MKTLFALILFHTAPVFLISQPLHFSTKYKVRFFCEGRVVTPETKNVSLHFDFDGMPHQQKDTVSFSEDFFLFSAWNETAAIITCIYKRDTMQIRTYGSIDSIPFKKGTYFIPRHYTHLFITGISGGVKLDQQNLDYFKTSSLFSEDINPKVLNCKKLPEIECRFWKDPGRKSMMRGKPAFYQIVQNDNFSPVIYGLNWSSVYRSSDYGMNWEQIVTTTKPYGTHKYFLKIKTLLFLSNPIPFTNLFIGVMFLKYIFHTITVIHGRWTPLLLNSGFIS